MAKRKIYGEVVCTARLVAVIQGLSHGSKGFYVIQFQVYGTTSYSMSKFQKLPRFQIYEQKKTL